MIKKIRNQLFSRKIPKWFKFFNLCILLPILIWPLIFYTTIFFFDKPKNIALTFLLFILVNIYPVYLIIIAYLNSLLFQKNKVLGSLLPSILLLTITFGVITVSTKASQHLNESKKEQEERTKHGFIGANEDFKVLNDKVYLYDTLIVGADPKTFEIVNWSWQRDKNYYYFLGKKVPAIDRQSFELLDYHYAKDKNYVYYDEAIIEGADAKTFHHIDGTQDGKDATHCYSWGEKVDCKVLLTEE
jgi:hypothetical protein